MGPMPKQELNACVLPKGRHTLTMKYSHKEPHKPYMKVNDLEFVALMFVALTALFIKITTIFKERLLNFDYIVFWGFFCWKEAINNKFTKFWG